MSKLLRLFQTSGRCYKNVTKSQIITLKLRVGWFSDINSREYLKDKCALEWSRGLELTSSQDGRVQTWSTLDVRLSNVAVQPLLPHPLHQPQPVQVGSLVGQEPVDTCPGNIVSQ